MPTRHSSTALCFLPLSNAILIHGSPLYSTSSQDSGATLMIPLVSPYSPSTGTMNAVFLAYRIVVTL